MPSQPKDPAHPGWIPHVTETEGTASRASATGGGGVMGGRHVFNRQHGRAAHSLPAEASSCLHLPRGRARCLAPAPLSRMPRPLWVCDNLAVLLYARILKPKIFGRSTASPAQRTPSREPRASCRRQAGQMVPFWPRLPVRGEKPGPGRCTPQRRVTGPKLCQRTAGPPDQDSRVREQKSIFGSQWAGKQPVGARRKQQGTVHRARTHGKLGSGSRNASAKFPGNPAGFPAQTCFQRFSNWFHCHLTYIHAPISYTVQ